MSMIPNKLNDKNSLKCRILGFNGILRPFSYTMILNPTRIPDKILSAKKCQKSNTKF